MSGKPIGDALQADCRKRCAQKIEHLRPVLELQGAVLPHRRAGGGWHGGFSIASKTVTAFARCNSSTWIVVAKARAARSLSEDGSQERRRKEEAAKVAAELSGRYKREIRSCGR